MLKCINEDRLRCTIKALDSVRNEWMKRSKGKPSVHLAPMKAQKTSRLISLHVPLLMVIFLHMILLSIYPFFWVAENSANGFWSDLPSFNLPETYRISENQKLWLKIIDFLKISHCNRKIKSGYFKNIVQCTSYKHFLSYLKELTSHLDNIFHKYDFN